MLITGIHINYYFLCHRKLWLFANHGIGYSRRICSRYKD
ncbi:MAG TPA: hypothetical protein DCE80_07315 [Ignavibacteriales bacterium]|nr:hypothetical protein [Ignavibacteriales bacterium]